MDGAIKGKIQDLAAGEFHLGSASVGMHCRERDDSARVDCTEHDPILLGSGTLKNQRAVDAPVGSDDEADADCRFRIYFF